MNHWSYQQYLLSVRQDMKYGVGSRNYSPEEAFGFAHEELTIRLDKFPHETPMALTALAVVLNEYAGLTRLSFDGGFRDEIIAAYQPQQLDEATSRLNSPDVNKFKKDVALVKSLLYL